MVKPRQKRRKRQEYNDEQKTFLCVGPAHSYQFADRRFFLPEGNWKRRGSFNWKTIRAAWTELRDELVSEFNVAGHRAWAWWIFDSPEPRRRVIRGYSAVDDPEGSQLTKILNFGRYYSCGWEEINFPPVWESSEAFLDRHGLLSDDEREVLGDDFPREELHCLKELSESSLPEYRTTWPPIKERGSCAN